MKKIIFDNMFSLAWLALCIVLYIYFPASRSYIQSVDVFTSSFLVENINLLFLVRHWINFVFAFLGVAILTFAYTALGEFISKVMGFKDLIKLETKLLPLTNLATYFLIGSAIYSIIFLTLAGLYKITFGLVLTSLLIGIFLGFREVIEKIRALPIFDNTKKLDLFWVNTFIFISALLLSSARISYDSTAIYFSNAKITAYSETIQYFTEDTFVASAFQNTIHFTAIIKVFGEQSARMFSWVCGLVIIIFTLALAEKVGISQKARVILATLLLTSTAFVDLLGDGKVDLINSAISIAAVYWIVVQNNRKIKNKQAFLLIGLFVGMSIISRPYNSFLFAIFICLFYFQQTILRQGLNQASWTEFFTPLFWIGAGAIGPGLYHLFANWMIHGNPFEFLKSLANINPTSGPWDADLQSMLALRILYPLTATFRNTPQSLGNISPLLIGFLPFILFATIRERVNISQLTKQLTFISIITLALWIFMFFTVVELRYVFFLWFILFIPASQIVSATLEVGDTIMRGLKFTLIVTLLIFFIFRTLIISISAYSPLDSNKNPQCTEYILCEYINSINQIALPNERVLSLSAYRYYLRNDLFYCSSKHEEYSILKELAQKDVNLFWEEVIRQGYTYIAYEFDYTTRHIQLGIIPSLENTPEWIKLERIDNVNSDAVAAYKIHTINPPIESQFTCVENDQNLLEVQLLP